VLSPEGDVIGPQSDRYSRSVSGSRTQSLLGALLCLVIVFLATPLAASAAPSAPHHAALLRWRSCGRVFECATLRVPTDYDRPKAGATSIAAIRRPADEPDRRIGSLVVNYGGPGDPGSETLRDAAASMPAAIRHRFDIVSFDPRGTGRSHPVDCVDDATFERAWAEDLTPDSRAELPSFYDGTAGSVDLVAECIHHNGRWLAHVGTRNVARDLDRLRTGLGEGRLTFLGYSYGTVLGAAYAQLFPDRVRAMVLDAPVDLSATMEQEQRANAAGFEHALDEFLADCAARPKCAFHSHGDPRGALDALRTRLERDERIPTAQGRTVGSAELYIALLSALYSRDDWAFLADSLQRAAKKNDGSGLEALSDIYAGRRTDGTYSNFQEALGIIVCDDRPEPLVSFDVFTAIYDEFSRDYPILGPPLGGGPVGCDPRLPSPRLDEQLGDVRVDHAPPLLLIGTTKDPATPYAGAQDLQQRIAGSALLTVDDTRHGGYATGNHCVDGIVDTYLIRGAVPPPGARCAGA
jgi:pimeloyl-ACP methyl ester carboxylesterase